MDKRLFDRLIVGCGYLGRRVARLWRDQQELVATLVRSEARAKEAAAEGLAPIRGDLFGPLPLPAARTVLFAAAQDRAGGRSPREFYVEGLRRILAALPRPEAGSTRFLFISSASVYGQTDGGWVDETAPTQPLSLAGQALLEAEALLFAFAAKEPWLRSTSLRFAGIYGPERLPRGAAIQAGQLLKTDPDGWLNLIHVDDGARLILALAERDDLVGVFNVADQEPVRRRDYCTLLAELLRAPAPRFDPPAQPDPNAHDAANRRIDGAKLRSALDFRLRLPTFREGLSSSILG